jgi:radical SAM protein with 4Fe4S-binding SPASM domain
MLQDKALSISHVLKFSLLCPDMCARIHDTLNMASRLDATRLANAARIYGSYQYSRWKRVPSMAGMPVSVSIEPTTSCNLRCPECPSGLRSFTRPTGMLKASLFRDVIDQLAPTLNYLTFYFQGEPYLHPDFLQMVQYASSKGIYTATSTNGHYLRDDLARATVESKLDRLIISIDGTTQETYQSYRIGGSLEKVLDGAARVVQWKRKLKSRTPHIIFQFLVVKPNEHQIADARALAHQIGVDDLVLKTAQIYNYQNGSDLIPDDPRYARYQKKADGTYEIRNRLLNECWRMWQGCVITWDGKVLPCCFDKDGTYVMGDLGRNAFRDIWYGDKYAAFRESLFRSRSEIEMCRNCTEGTVAGF